MSIFAFYGSLWGFSVKTVDGDKVLCSSCYKKAKQEEQVRKVFCAYGTEGVDYEEGKNFVYICEGDGCNDECTTEG